MVIQNFDPQLIDHASSSSSPFHLKVDSVDEHEVKVEINRGWQHGKMLSIKSSCPVKPFGISLNISESYDVKNVLEMVQHLIELERYPDTPRLGNDT